MICFFRRLVIIAWSFIALPSCLFAIEDISIIQSVFLPTTFYIGDSVEMRVMFQTPFDKNLTIPSTMPSMDWGVIHSMELVELTDRLELRVEFTSWASGTQTFPDIRVGSLSFEQLTVHIPSIIEKEEGRSAKIQGPVVIKGTVFLGILQILVILAVLGASIFLMVLIIPRLRQLRKRWALNQPLRRAQKSLKELALQAHVQEPRAIYISLLEETRTYFSDRLQIPALSATTSELEKLLLPCVQKTAIISEIIDLFKQGDRIKFAHISGNRDLAIQQIHALIVLLRAFEEDLPHAGL